MNLKVNGTGPENESEQKDYKIAPMMLVNEVSKLMWDNIKNKRGVEHPVSQRSGQLILMELAKRDFKEADLLTDEEIADILPVAQDLAKWVEDLLAYATAQAENGKTWPGYKLVASVTKRKYTNDADVIRACTEAGFTNIYKTTLLGISDLEKAIGKKAFKDVVSPYVFKPEGKPELVPLSDRRKPISSAEADFAE